MIPTEMLDDWRAQVAQVGQRARLRAAIGDDAEPADWWQLGVADGLEMAVNALGDLIHDDGEATPDA